MLRRSENHPGAGEAQVAVDDALAVGLVEGVGDLDAVAEDLLRRHRPLRKAFSEGLPLEELHDDVVGLFLTADVVQHADVGMFQAGDGPGLALEALASFGIGLEGRRQDLDRDRTVQPRIPRLVGLSHPALAELGLDFVGTESDAGIEYHHFPAIMECRGGNTIGWT